MVLNFLRQRGVLKYSMNCLTCYVQMRQVRRNGSPDSFSFRCCNTHCAKFQSYRSLRSESMLEHLKISLQKFIHVVYLYSRETSRKEISDTTGVSLSVIYKIVKLIRSRIGDYFGRNPILIGGPNVIVQIDESKFNFNVKAHRGVAPSEAIWVFGIVDTSFKPARGYMQVVAHRDRETLCEIIQRVVRPNSIIHSDEWMAYSNVSTLGYEHGTVCHKYNFVAPLSGVHTQHVESYWNRQKLRVKRMKGLCKNIMEEVLNEFMFFDWFCDSVFDALIDKIVKS
jgi:hypothetical protein